ncbi:MAG: RloB domain-containing protein [Thermoplasmata archaeon]|nr:RloB domain-containing protein [Thermoplasmata archaeon]
MSQRAHLGGRMGHRRPADVYVIIGEGASETLYFDMMSRIFPGVSVQTCDAKGGDLRSMKQAVSREASRSGKNDRIAVVMDVDEKTPVQIGEFDRWCQDRGVDLYVSNPSFEVYLLMHYRSVHSSLTQKDLEEALSVSTGRRYDKGRGIRISEETVMEALRRAEDSLPDSGTAVDVAMRPGTTTVHKLVMKIAGLTGERPGPLQPVTMLPSGATAKAVT